MLGQIIRDGKPVATLQDDGTWTAPDANVAAVLNARYPGHGDPALGNAAAAAVRKAAKALGAEAEVPEREGAKESPEVVY